MSRIGEIIVGPIAADSFGKYTNGAKPWKLRTRIKLENSKEFMEQYPQMEMGTGRFHQKLKPEMQISIEGLDADRNYNLFLSLNITAPNRFKYARGKFVATKEEASSYEKVEIPINKEPRSGAFWMTGVHTLKGFKISHTGPTNVDQKIFHVAVLNEYMPVITIREHENPITAAFYLFAAAAFFPVSSYKNPSMGSWKATLGWPEERKQAYLNRERKVKREPVDVDDDAIVNNNNGMAPLPMAPIPGPSQSPIVLD